MYSNPDIKFLFEQMGFLMDRRTEDQVYELRMAFSEATSHV